VIFSSLPFVHLPAKRRRDDLCWHCLGSSSKRLLLDHNTISFIGCPSCPTVQYCSPACQAADQIHPLECKHFSALETLPELAHITARLLLLVAEENVEAEELPFGQGSRGFWDLLSHASRIPDDDYWSVKIFQQVGCLQTQNNSQLSS